MLTEVIATRYVTPLREGGSLPGIVEADGLGAYVMSGAGRYVVLGQRGCARRAATGVGRYGVHSRAFCA
ncbi:hypothetical protein FNJ62_24910 [Streptomyces benahoarensis]|uniref:Uncharacterized protein n=1 Tax=Streptomyces benahoarensis TaxID=2595054 RepID=A0A553Z1X1_9ACTN|nr:hypothetical protein [Streptomyces benahoarensis]TSB18179.1 hypothetical protein FNJ62_24910 [Streptomyces benahoarensis]TSB35424.1 hypothetical protein FNZ23_21080 [Streptomyces benahoarensis]